MTGAGPEKQPTGDEETVGRLGYAQELHRSLSWFSLFSVSFSIMSIATGVFLNFTFGITQLGPVSIWLWPAVGVGQLLVALVLSELGTRIPLAGAGYSGVHGWSGLPTDGSSAHWASCTPPWACRASSTSPSPR
ncbi:hypothetical protein [Streptomyces salinarius]|uniref:Amino acid permease n=1 Tax=Streptomyces salinarius TaxID=2762598 RepID=A0ABW8BBE8_9ACTN